MANEPLFISHPDGIMGWVQDRRHDGYSFALINEELRTWGWRIVIHEYDDEVIVMAEEIGDA